MDDGYEVPRSAARNKVSLEWSDDHNEPEKKTGPEYLNERANNVYEEIDMDDFKVPRNLRDAAQIAMKPESRSPPPIKPPPSPPKEPVQGRAQQKHLWPKSKQLFIALTSLLVALFVLYIVFQLLVLGHETLPNAGQAKQNESFLEETGCHDMVPQCYAYEEKGDCESNRRRMFQHCPESCKRCDENATATYTDEDIWDPLKATPRYDDLAHTIPIADGMLAYTDDQIDLWLASNRSNELRRFQSCPFNYSDTFYLTPMPQSDILVGRIANNPNVFFFDFTTCAVVFEKTLDYVPYYCRCSKREIVMTDENAYIHVYHWTDSEIKPIVEITTSSTQLAYPSVSENGVMIYRSGKIMSEIQVFNVSSNISMPSVSSRLYYESLLISPDGKVAVAVSAQGPWELLSVVTGRRLYFSSEEHPLNALVISRDNRNILFEDLFSHYIKIFRFDDVFHLLFSTTLNADTYVSSSYIFRNINGKEHLQATNKYSGALNLIRVNDVSHSWDLL